MSKYPECFPDNFEEKILPGEAKQENIPVYRIIKYRKIDRDEFIGTYEEVYLRFLLIHKCHVLFWCEVIVKLIDVVRSWGPIRRGSA